MEATIQSNNPDCLFLARLRHDGFFANAAPWGEFSERKIRGNPPKTSTKPLLVEIFNAMDLVRGINGEWYPIKTFTANHAAKTLRMIGFPSGPQNSVQNRLGANATLLQSVQIILFAVRVAFKRIKRFPLKINRALVTGKTFRVVDLIHRGATAVFPHDLQKQRINHALIEWGRLHYLIPAFDADPVHVPFRFPAHPLNQHVGESVYLLFLVNAYPTCRLAGTTERGVYRVV